MDLNHRTPKRPDLQSGAIATLPPRHNKIDDAAVKIRTSCAHFSRQRPTQARCPRSPQGSVAQAHRIAMSGVRFLAGETGFEPAAYGFGDRCSAVELHPIIQKYETRSAAAGGFQCFHTDEETVQVTLSALSAVQPAATPRIYRLVYRQRMKG